MSSSNLIILLVSLGLEAWLLALLFRRRVRKHFPFFFFYILIIVPVTVARLVTTDHYYAYFFTYWWSTVVLMVLGLAALNEVFRWVYEDFYRLRWFQFLYYGATVLVLLVTVRNAIVNPPVQA